MNKAFDKINLEDYDLARKEFLCLFSGLKKIKAIYECGTVSKPGLSDLDFLLVLSNQWTSVDTEKYYKKRLLFSKNLKNIMQDSTILLIPSALHSNLLLIDNFNVRKLSSGKNSSLIEFNTLEDEISRVLDWLPERVLKLHTFLERTNDKSHLYDINFQRSSHSLLKSLFVSLEKANHILHSKAHHSKYQKAMSFLINLRQFWFKYSNEKQSQLLLDVMLDTAELSRDFLIDFSNFILDSNYLKFKKFCNCELSFGCFSIKSHNNFNIKANPGLNTLHIPNIYFLNYYLQSSFNTSLSKILEAELKVCEHFTHDNIQFERNMINTLKIRNWFVEENLNFITRCKLIDGLLKYGMILRYPYITHQI